MSFRRFLSGVQLQNAYGTYDRYDHDFRVRRFVENQNKNISECGYLRQTGRTTREICRAIYAFLCGTKDVWYRTYNYSEQARCYKIAKSIMNSSSGVSACAQEFEYFEHQRVIRKNKDLFTTPNVLAFGPCSSLSNNPIIHTDNSVTDKEQYGQNDI